MKTSREINVMSSPAQSPQYVMTIPKGTPVERARGMRRSDWVVAPAGFPMVKGSNLWDLEHYYVWVPNDEVEPS